MNLQDKINELYSTPSDINEHFPVILKYGSKCNHITEMGVRSIISTWGWLACVPKKLICYDLEDPVKWGGNIQEVYDVAEKYGVEFNFIQANVLDIEIEPTELLFIDTWHSYIQLSQELIKHSEYVSKYICFHDSTSYETHDEPINFKYEASKFGVWTAIDEFLEINKNKWKLKERFVNNNGFTIIERI